MANDKKVNKNEINYKDNLKIYWSFLKKYKATLSIILFLSLILESLKLINPFLFKAIVDNTPLFIEGSLLKTSFMSILFIITIIFFSNMVLRAVLEWIYMSKINRVETQLTFDLKKKFFNHILNLSHSFHINNKTGSLISRLTRGGGTMERMTDVIIFNITPLVFSFIALTVAFFYFSWKSIIVLFLMVISFLAYSFFIQNKQKISGIQANKDEDREKANIADIFTNIDAIKYYGKEKLIEKRFEKLSQQTRFSFLKFYNYYRWMDSGQQIIIGVGTFFLLFFPVIELLNGDITLGTLVFIYTAYGNIFYPLYGFVHGIRNYYRAMADFDGLFKYGKVEKEVKDKKNSRGLKVSRGEIEIKDVLFKYGKRKIFENFSLKIPHGKKVALVGHSGCGKTTLVKLIYRFYDLEKGSIEIDNQDIKDVKQESLRESMSIVPQECVLFDDTIFNNIKFSNPTATKKEVMKAIKFARLDKIIKTLPNKEDTIVGERGIKLSGGEKQRVSIARAILANKKILVLDEATSSLDSETEFEIQQDLKKLMQGRTSIIIAHRLSTIMHADIIVVMKRGNIAQLGSHRDLITEGGEYQRLWDLQKGGYI
jgi:ATP-binding cassette subfamily B protein